MGDRANAPPEPGDPTEWEGTGPAERSDVDVPEAGQGLVEYGLGLFLMAIVILVILQLVGPKIGSIFSIVTRMG